MSSGKTDTRITSDMMHNENALRYLMALEIPTDEVTLNKLCENISQELGDILQEINDLKTNIKAKSATDEQLPLKQQTKPKAGELFSRFYNAIQNASSDLIELSNSNPQELQDVVKCINNLITSVLNNDNHNLEATYDKMRHITDNHVPIDEPIESKVITFFQDSWFPVNSNRITPASEESLYSRFKTISPMHDFTPQDRTNLPNVRHYSYNHSHTELRFGTQSQCVGGQYRVAPVFDAWLSVQDNKYKDDGEDNIHHAYFNSLGVDGANIERILDGTAITRNRELQLSEPLHALENEHKIAVITLPSDKGLMSNSYVTQTTNTESKDIVMKRFMSIAMGGKDIKSQSNGIEDFHISRKIWGKLFVKVNNNDIASSTEDSHTTSVSSEYDVTKYFDGTNANIIFNDLLSKSFKRLGFDQKDALTKAEQQAVWFDFIKFELTNFIIKKLKPKTINFTCKDAIDRGGVSSAYYNLMKSIELEAPISRDEFNMALQAAPTMVKARGMNTHINRIWNAVDAYLNNNNLLYSKPAWLEQWRTENCPPERAGQLLDILLEKHQSGHKKTPANDIFNEVAVLNKQNIGHKALLLSVISLIPKDGKDWSPEAIEKYQTLANQLPLISPAFLYLSGCMLILIGNFLLASAKLVNSEKLQSIAQSIIDDGEERKLPSSPIDTLKSISFNK